jgi:hypothetical protein
MEFRQHLLAVLPIHVPTGRVCIRRTTGRCCRNSDSDGGGTWKLPHSTHSRAVQKNVDNPKEIPSQICTDSHTNDCVSLLDGRRLTRLHDLLTTTIRKRGDLYLGWQRRGGSVHEDDQGPLRHVLLCKTTKTSLLVENFGRTSPVRGGFQNLQEKLSAQRPTSTFGAR